MLRKEIWFQSFISLSFASIRIPLSLSYICLAIFFNLQTLGNGIDFCFDGSKEGTFLRKLGDITDSLHATTLK